MSRQARVYKALFDLAEAQNPDEPGNTLNDESPRSPSQRHVQHKKLEQPITTKA
jgi:hypothetical protein